MPYTLLYIVREVANFNLHLESDHETFKSRSLVKTAEINTYIFFLPLD